MKQNKNIELKGEVLESLPNAMFRVKTDDGKKVLCTIAGKMRMYRIKVMPGDRVKLEVTPYDETKGRIVFRE